MKLSMFEPLFFEKGGKCTKETGDMFAFTINEQKTKAKGESCFAINHTKQFWIVAYFCSYFHAE